MTELSIILVNWNCLDYTEHCLASIRDVTIGIDYEVIVVDNDSGDAPCQGLVDRYPWIKLILSPQNLGFGRANNLGVMHSTGTHLLFLNPDTLVLGDALRQMLQTLTSLPCGGAVGCRLLNADGSLQTTCVQAFPTVLNQVLALHWLQRRWPSLSIWGKQALYSDKGDIMHEVEVVSGAAILVKRSVFEQAEGFSPEYFMYAEEVDLCLAIHRAGYKIGYASNAQIIHFGGQSTKKCEDDFAAVTMRDSVYRFMRRSHGRSYAMFYRLAIAASALLRILVIVCLLPFIALLGGTGATQDLSRTLRKWSRIAKWCIGINPLIPSPNQHSGTSAGPAKSLNH